MSKMNFLYFFLLCSMLAKSVAQSRAEDTADSFLKNMNVEINHTCVESNNYYVRFNMTNCDDPLRKDIISLTQNSPVDFTISALCRKDKYLCHDTVNTGLYRCLSQSQKDYLQQRALSDNAMTEYYCHHNGQALRDVSNVDLSKCALKGDSKNCENLHQSVKEIPYENYYDENNCRKHLELAECVANLYKNCLDQTIYNFIKNASQYSLRATPCGKYMTFKQECTCGSSVTSKLNPVLMLIFFICIYNNFCK